MKVTLYSTDTSKNSQLLKNYFNEKKVPFLEKQINRNEFFQSELAKIAAGFSGVPVVLIQKEGDSSQIVIGFDKGKINSILGL